MFPLDASGELVIQTGEGLTKHAKNWLYEKIFTIIENSKPTKVITEQDTIIYEAHLNRYTWNPFWYNHLGISDMGYFEILSIGGNVVIKYKILFHEIFLAFLYYMFFIFLFLLLIDFPIFPWKVGIVFFFILGNLFSYFSTVIWLNMIIREFISEYQFRANQGNFASSMET